MSTRVTRKILCRNENWQQKTRFCCRGLLQLAYYMDSMHIFETNVIKTCAVWLLTKQTLLTNPRKRFAAQEQHEHKRTHGTTDEHKLPTKVIYQ